MRTSHTELCTHALELVAWRSDSYAFHLINEVTVRRARLALGWVTAYVGR